MATYLRFTQRANADGSVVRYVALAHNRRVYGQTKPDVLLDLGRVDRLDVDGLRRLAASINNHFGDGNGYGDAVEVGLAAGTEVWMRRLLVVAGAVVAAVAVYLVETLAFDLDLKGPAMSNQASADVTLVNVIGVSAVVSLVAWALLAILEKITSKGRTIWTVIAVLVFLLSLGGPFSGTGISTNTRLSLALMHLTVAAVLILFLPGRTRQTATA